MQLVFLDESGSPYTSYKSFRDGYLSDLVAAKQGQAQQFPSYPFFVVAAVSLPESQYSTVDDWFRSMKSGYLGAGPEDVGPEYEIKGSVLYALRKGQRPIEWTPGKGRKRPYTTAQKAIWTPLTPNQLTSLETSLFDLFHRIGPVVWVVVVKQAHVYKRYGNKTWPPHHWALTYLQQRVAQHVQANHGAYQQGLFVMDETSTLSTAAQLGDFLRTRGAINSTASWPVNFRRYLVDVPVTGKSHLIQALQLADVVAHAVWRKIHNDDALKWFEGVEPFLAIHWRGGTYKNAGLTFIQ